ncbi:hypothetical protein HDU89_005343 [Geranomyces variabilis]|nr:hypothetical protein HDU89_005343 [Geranomyces variabilis]
MSSEASPPAAAAPAGPRRPSQYEQCQEEIRQLHAQQKKKAHARERAPSAEVARNSGQAKKAKHTTAVAAESDVVAHAEEETGGGGVGDGDGAQRPVVRAGGASATTAPATSSSSPVPGTSSGGGVQLMDDVEELGAPIDLRDRRGILKKMMERGHSQSLVEMFTLERSPGKEEVERMAQQLHLHPQEVWDFFEAMRATALARWTREKKEAGEAAHVGTAFPPTSSRRSSHYGTTPSDRIPTADRTSIPPSSSSAQSEAARRASFVQQAPRSIVMIDPYGRRPSLVLNPVIPGAQLMPGQLVYPGPAGTPGYIAAQVYYPQGTTPQSSHASTASHGEQKHAPQQQKAQQQHGHRRPSTAPGGGGGNAGSYQAQHEKKQQQHTPTPTPVTPGGGHSSQQNYFQQPPLVYVPQYYLPPMGYQDPNQQQQRQQHKQQHQQQQQHQTRRPSTASRNPSFAAAGSGGPPPTMQPHHHPSTGPARPRAGSQAFNVNHFAGGSGGASAPVPGTVSYVPISATAATSGTAMHTSNGNSHYQHHSTTNSNSHHHHPSASTTSRSSSSSAQQQHRAHDYYQPRTAAPAAMVIDPVLEHRRSAASVPTAATVAAAAAAARTRRMSAAGLAPAPRPAPYDKA